MEIMKLLNALPGAVSQGVIWGIMAIGVYITYRILDVADLTVDGSIATGGAVAAGSIWGRYRPESHTPSTPIGTLMRKIQCQVA